MKRFYTLAVVRQHDKVLLARKARGFGEGVWNGFGGKVEAGETIEEAAIRECQEEACITPTHMNSRGVLTFHYTEPQRIHLVRIFEVTQFSGTPTDTAEMSDPTWFSIDQIPYASMWADDQFWMPLLLAGKSFSGEFSFDAQNRIVDYNLEESIVFRDFENARHRE